MSEHAKHIQRAIQLARQARANGNHPFGALLVVDSEVALEAQNTVVTGRSPVQHAELNLVQLAWLQLSLSLRSTSELWQETSSASGA